MHPENLSSIYPHFIIVPERGIFPEIRLPFNFRELVQKFYSCNGKEKIERYAENVRGLLKQTGNTMEIMLNWSDRDGLRNISIGMQGGLDLEESPHPHFQEHNLGGANGLYAAVIAIEYTRELLK